MSDGQVSEAPVVIQDRIARTIFHVIQEEELYDPLKHDFGSAVVVLRKQGQFRLDSHDRHTAYFKINNVPRASEQAYELVVSTTTGGEDFGGLDHTASRPAFKVTYFSKYTVQPLDQHQVRRQFSGQEDLDLLLKKADALGLSLEALDERLQAAGLPRKNMDRTKAAYDLPRMILQAIGYTPFPAALKMDVKQPSQRTIEVAATYHPDFVTASRLKARRSDTTKEIRINLFAAMHRRQPGT